MDLTNSCRLLHPKMERTLLYLNQHRMMATTPFGIPFLDQLLPSWLIIRLCEHSRQRDHTKEDHSRKQRTLSIAHTGIATHTILKWFLLQHSLPSCPTGAQAKVSIESRSDEVMQSICNESQSHWTLAFLPPLLYHLLPSTSSLSSIPLTMDILFGDYMTGIPAFYQGPHTRRTDYQQYSFRYHHSCVRNHSIFWQGGWVYLEVSQSKITTRAIYWMLDILA